MCVKMHRFKKRNATNRPRKTIFRLFWDGFFFMDIYKRLLTYIHPFKWKLVLAALCMLFYSLANSFVSVTIYFVTNGFIQKNAVSLTVPKLDWVLTFSVALIPVFVVAVFFFRGLFDYLSNYLMATIGQRAVMNIRNELYGHLIKQDVAFYSKGKTGDLMSRIMNDVGQIQGAITDVLVDLFKQPLVILFNVPLVIYWDYKLAFICLVVFPMVAIPIAYFGRKLRSISKRIQERTSDVTTILQETFTGIRIVKSFNMEDKEFAKFRGVNKGVLNYIIKIVRITVIQRPMIEVLGALGVAFTVWYGLKYLPLDRFTAFVTSLFILYEPLKKISKVNSTIQQSIGAGSRIFEIMDVEPEIKDAPHAREFREEIKTIEFANISFSYAPETPVLQNINLLVNSGDVIAIVGSSGSGKTTLVNLIPRFYDPVGGSLSINGRDIRDFTLRSLRSKIGYVTQETILFNDSVGDNIAYGRDNATFDEVKEAAIHAQAHDFIMELPEGYDTVIGEKGVMLSGGQRQRLSIARAILKNPPILILDEATSMLDTESEREVQFAIEYLMQNKTVFVIAHRLSTIQNATRIIVLDQGQIVQVGSSGDLLEEEGPYKRLYELQFNV